MVLIHVFFLLIILICAECLDEVNYETMTESVCKVVEGALCDERNNSSLNLPHLWNLNEITEEEKSRILELKDEYMK